MTALVTNRYTCLGEDADLRVQRDLDVLREYCAKHFPDLLATILVGGFGRGEGGVLVDEDGGFRPVNDYDLVVVTKKKIPLDLIREARAKLARTIGIDYVDIVNLPERMLPKLGPTLFNYDLANASTVLDGDETVLTAIPRFASADIRTEEAEVLLFTRAWCFLGHYRLAHERVEPEGYEAFQLYQQVSKALLAYQDAMLILHGRYTPKYADRPAVFKDQFPERTDVFPLLEKATEAKLKPKISRGPDAMRLYHVARDLFITGFYEVGSLLYEAEIKACGDYADRYLNCSRCRSRRWMGAIKGNRYWERTQFVNVAQLLLLASQASAAAGAEEPTVIRRVRAALGVFEPVATLPSDWDGLRAKAAELRMKV